MTQNKIVPITIIIIGIIISLGIFIGRYERPTEDIDSEKNSNIKLIEISPIDENDHILGSPDAKIIIMEFSHLQCTFSRNFHSTMRRIISEFGHSGEVAWVIRHFPVEELYEFSLKASVAAECAFEYGRENDIPAAFWEFHETIYGQNIFDINDKILKDTALNIGVDSAFYNTCITLNPRKSKIARDIEDANKLIEADPNFVTPYNLIITNSGQEMRISGALQYEELRDLIIQILDQ